MCNGIRRVNYLVTTPQVNSSSESQSESVSDGMSRSRASIFIILDGIVLF